MGLNGCDFEMDVYGNTMEILGLKDFLIPTCSMYGIIYLQNWVIFRANVGNYSSTMEHMGQD